MESQYRKAAHYYKYRKYNNLYTSLKRPLYQYGGNGKREEIRLAPPYDKDELIDAYIERARNWSSDNIDCFFQIYDDVASQEGLDWLDRLTDEVDMEKFIQKPETIDLIKETVDNSGRMETISDSMCVVLPYSKSTGNVSKILDKMIYRVPINIAGDIGGNSEQMSKYLGYEMTSAQENYNEMTYSIGGIAYTQDKGTIGVCHTWAPNFESQESTDYKKMVKDGELDEDMYEKKMKQILLPLLRCALSVGQKVIESTRKDPNTKITLRLPLIGQGAFLQALDDSERLKCNKVFFRVIKESVSDMDDQLDVALLIFNPDEFEDPVFKDVHSIPVRLGRDDANWEVTDWSESDRLFTYLGRNGGNIVAPQWEHEDVLVLANAWDDFSLIGNGGYADKSVDGFMVSGRFGISNTSYLHNIAFTPSSLDVRRWEWLDA